MDETQTIALEADERDTFLGTGGVGVLSLSTADTEPPHSLPVSYGYHAEAETFYFRLAAGGDSRKGPVEDRPVTFVTYGQDSEDEWRSVVASGRLQSLEADEVATDALAGLDSVRIPLVDIFGVPPREVTFEFVRLDPDRLTARKEATVGV